MFVCLFESCDLWVGSGIGIGIGCVKKKRPIFVLGQMGEKV